MKEFFDPASYVFTYMNDSYTGYVSEVEKYGDEVATALKENGFVWKFRFSVEEYLCTSVDKVLPYNNAKFKDEISIVICTTAGSSYKDSSGTWTLIPNGVQSTFFKDNLVYI